jgi:two-component system LytT family response regulator/two-component system response regulator LytT
MIVDDEKPARDELRYLLSRYEDLHICAECDNGEDAIAKAALLKPDVIFLDIQMRSISGIETGRIIRKLVPDTLLVFATAYDEYAINAFDVHAVDYLLKPFDEERLQDTIDHLRKFTTEDKLAHLDSIDKSLPEIPSTPLQKLVLEKEGRIHLIDLTDLIFIHINNGIVRVVSEAGLFTYNDTLSSLEDKLRNTLIKRVHRSYLVNLCKVREILPWYKSTYWLKVPLPGKKELGEIPVGKSHIKEIKEILGIK